MSSYNKYNFIEFRFVSPAPKVAVRANGWLFNCPAVVYDGGVYSSFVELPSLPFFDSDVAIIIIIFISLPSSAHTLRPLCFTSPRIIEDMSHA